MKNRGMPAVSIRLWILSLLLCLPSWAVPGQASRFDYLDSHTAVMLLIDPDTGIIRDANKAASEFYGYTFEELKGMNISRINILSPEEVQAELREAASQRRNYFVFPHRLAGGEVRTVEVYSSPVEAPLYGKEMLLSIIHDITGKSVPEAEMEAYRVRLNALVEERARELVAARLMNLVLAVAALLASLVGLVMVLHFRGQRRAAASVRAALAERNKLFTELQHRVKNSFATIASIIHIETARSENPEAQAALETLGGRVETLAALYRLMYEDRSDEAIDLSDYLREIADSISEAIGAPGMSLEFDSRVESLSWDAKRASSLGLILNELVTNACKHASKESPGTVSVRLDRTDGNLELAVSNPGGPLPSGFSPGEGRGFGLLMVMELVKQFKGELEFSSRGGLVEFRVRVPV